MATTTIEIKPVDEHWHSVTVRIVDGDKTQRFFGSGCFPGSVAYDLHRQIVASEEAANVHAPRSKRRHREFYADAARETRKIYDAWIAETKSA